MEQVWTGPENLFKRYEELQSYVGWTTADADRVTRVAERLDPQLPSLIDDFYKEIARHPSASKVITGGDEQVQRLKGTLLQWLRELLRGPYDADYVTRRWRVGWRHVEIGLSQVYTNVALSRLRRGLTRALWTAWQGDADQLHATLDALHRLLDLDLAIIEDAYQSEYLSRQQQIERLATIGQMAAGIAHEVRQPLNVMKTSVYFLRHARNPTLQKTAEHLERIDRQVEIADRVITAMGDFARLPTPNVEPVAVEQCVRDALQVSNMPENIEVRIDCPAETPPVLADPGQLQIVLSNLFRNARDAMPQGGTLSITANTTGQFCQIVVADTGEGIAPQALHRVMEPLYTTKARGVGFGLAIVRAIIEKHGGQVRVDSELGQGATFTLRIPCQGGQENT